MTILKKIADLGDYLDQGGHKEEAHEIDHMLKAIAEDEPLLYKMLGVHQKTTPGYGGQNASGNMGEEENSPIAKKEPTPTAQETPQPSGTSGRKPLSYSAIMQAKKGGSNEEALKYMIYSYYLDEATARWAAKNKTFEEALQDGLKRKFITDDQSKWYNPTTWNR